MTENVIRQNKGKFSSMSFSKKLEYILEYYKLHIILGLIVIYIISYAGYRNITNKEVAYSIAFANLSLDSSTYDQINDYYIDQLNLDSSKCKIEMYKELYIATEDNLTSDSDYEYAYVSTSKLMALLAQGDLDIIFTDYKTAQILSDKGYLKKISNGKYYESADNLPFFEDIPVYICKPIK